MALIKAEKEKEANWLILIDTLAWIHALRPNGSPAIRETVKEVLGNGLAASTEMVVLELAGGVKEQEKYSELVEELLAVHQLSADKDTWRLAFSLHFDMRRKGITVPSPDILIAAVAIKNRCSLLQDDKHFKLIAKHTSLRLL